MLTNLMVALNKPMFNWSRTFFKEKCPFETDSPCRPKRPLMVADKFRGRDCGFNLSMLPSDTSGRYTCGRKNYRYGDRHGIT